MCRSADLVEAWTVRVTGTARETPTYHDPISRQRFRSRIAVAKHFGLMVRGGVGRKSGAHHGPRSDPLSPSLISHHVQPAPHTSTKTILG